MREGGKHSLLLVTDVGIVLDDGEVLNNIDHVDDAA
jgi:hypothetical protein